MVECVQCNFYFTIHITFFSENLLDWSPDGNYYPVPMCYPSSIAIV